MKRIDFDQAKWDVIDCPGDEAAALRWFLEHQGEPYDLRGMFRFVWGGLRESRGKSFCSEAFCAALQIKEAWRYLPCHLETLVQQRSVR